MVKEIGIKRTILGPDGSIQAYERAENRMSEAIEKAVFRQSIFGKYSLLDDAYRGSGGFETGNYLIPHTAESAEKYARRKQMSYYINFIKPIIDSHVNPIFKSEPVRDGMSEIFELFTKNVDGNNTTLTRFMKKAAIRAKLHGVEFIVIDSPKINDDTVLTKKRVMEDRIYPYLYLVSPSQVTDWSTDKFGRLISISYSIDNKTVDEEGKVKTVSETWTWTDSICKKSIGDDEEIFPNPIGKIPVVPLYGVINATDDLIPQSDLYGVARSSLALYNCLSELRCKNNAQAFSVLIYPIGDEDDYDNPEQDPIKIGVSDTLLYRNGQQAPKFISPSSDPNDMLMQEANLIIKEIFRQANLSFMNQQNISNVSGIAKKWDNLQLFRTILELAENLQTVEDKLAILFGLYVNEDLSSYTVTYNKEYGVVDVTETLANSLTAFGMNISEGLNYETKKKVIRAMTDDSDTSVTDRLLAELDKSPEKGAQLDVSNVSSIQPTGA